MVRRLAGLALIAGLVAGCSTGAGTTSPPGPSNLTPTSAMDSSTAAIIADYQKRIPDLMAEQNVPGLAVAVVDGDHVLWAQGFGYADRDTQTPVTLNTIFSVQSMSKLFTATAVMRAVQEGKVDLDVPITTYLPDFTVKSAFEQHPERKITLRMLLSHTAGFTHEAPVGNNYELDPGTFEEHIKSIEDTWLRYPVGTGYAYSNLGIDLAGYILEKVYERPFAQVMNDEVLGPVGMSGSTFDRAAIDERADRAIGYTALDIPSPLVDVPMTAAGGLYASISDLARFLSFQLGDGTIDGRVVLESGLMAEQRTVPAPNAGSAAGYALGVMRTRWRAERYQDIFNHGGGGFGFLSDLWWVPTMQLGIAVLTNSSEHKLQGDLAISILRDLVDTGSTYQQRLAALPYQSDVVDLDTSYQAPAGMADLVTAAAIPATSDQANRWATYEGKYQIAQMGVISPTRPASRFLVSGGVPYFDTVDHDTDTVLARHRLAEIQPGLFLADNGETLDFRSQQPSWRNLDLLPAQGGPMPWQFGLFGLFVIAWMVWLVGGVAAALVRRRRPTAPPDHQIGRRSQWLTAIVALVTGLLAMATMGLVLLMPGLVDSGFLGGLKTPVALRLVFHLPLALAVLGCLMAGLSCAVVAGRWGTPEYRLRFVALTIAVALLVGQLAAWRLIGWGLS
jgi:CubicO group peptidase (beta-lactamase class C family)